MAEDELPADILLRRAGPESYSETDPGPQRAPITRWLNARLEQVRKETLAGARGWHALMSRPVVADRKQPLKAQRDKLRKSHRYEDGWRFRVLTEWGGEGGRQQYHTLWAHYDPSSVPGERGAPQGRPARVSGSPAPPTTPQRLAPPPAPLPPPLVPTPDPPPPEGARGPGLEGLPGMDWVGDDDGMPLREVEE